MEGVYCPRHGDAMQQVRKGNVVTDVCRHGCFFFDAGELQNLIGFARANPDYSIPTVPEGRRVHDPREFALGSGHGHHKREGFLEGLFDSD